MKKKMIIHIGPHKTGTTYMQKIFFNNKEKLLANGIIYPDDGLGVQYGHHEIAEQLYIKNYVAVEEYISNIKKNDCDVLISSENFDRLKIEDILFFKGLLDDYQIQVVFVKRAFDDLLVSNWQESIKHGAIESWESYSLRHIMKPFISDVINPNKILDIYTEVFGLNSIFIIDYNDLKEKNLDICDVFFHIFDKKYLYGIGSKEHINNSMPYIDVELIRVLNVQHKNYGQVPHHFVREAYIKFRKYNKNNSEYIKLKKVISKYMKQINFSDTLVFNTLNNSFKNKYSKLVVNESVDKKIVHNRVFNLPDENWILEKDVSELINSLYLNVIKYLEER